MESARPSDPEATPSSRATRPGLGPSRLTRPDRRRLALALSLSLVSHVLLLLSLNSDGQEPGFPAFRFPWQDRRVEVRELRVVLDPRRVDASEPAARSRLPSVAKPLQPAPIKPPPAPGPVDRSPVSTTQPPRPTADAMVAKADRSAEGLPPPDLAHDPVDAKAPSPAAASGSVTPAPSAERGVIAVERSDEAALVVPPTPPEPSPAFAVALRASNAEQSEAARVEAARLETQRQEAAQQAARQEVEQQEAAREEAMQVEATRSEAERRKAEQQAAQPAVMQQEAARQQAARVETTRLEAERKEAEQQAAARLELARQEAARQDAAQLEAARLEAERQKAAQEAMTRQEVAQQEATRQEAARVEVARTEAERQKAEQEAATRRELAQQEVTRQQAAQAEADRQDAAQEAATRREAAQQEAARPQAAGAEAARQETQREEAAQQAGRREAAQQEAALQQAARVEGARLEGERAEAARLSAAKAEADRREAVLRAIGRQLDAEAALRAAATARPSDRRPYSLSTARRGRLFGHADPNAELVRYGEAWARKIQFNTPFDTVREVATHPHVDPMVTVAVRSDGSVESVTIVLSSGSTEIDEALRRIVQSHEHYQAFPPELARDYDVIEIRRTWYFDGAVRLY